LPDQVRARVRVEVAKDLTRQPADMVWQHLASTVTPLCTRRRRTMAVA
jgi:hypothetical protein